MNQLQMLLTVILLILMEIILLLLLIRLILLNSQQCQTANNGTKNVEIMVPLKYLRNFWRTLEMTLINCEINLDLYWCEKKALLWVLWATQYNLWGVLKFFQNFLFLLC